MGTKGPGPSPGEAGLSPLLVGRDRELALLLALVDAVPERGGALVVRGEAGIGKTALVEVACARASEQVNVLRTTAVGSETRLPFAGLHQLLLPFLGRLDSLPEVQRRALEVALGLAPREATPDVFLVGLATLGLLSDAAAERPLLLVVEDAQWVDRSSGLVFAFFARRLEAEPVLIWFTARTGVASVMDDAGLPELELDALGEEAAARLLAAQAPGLSAGLTRRVLAEAQGNPLALVELPLAAASTGPLQLTARLERAFASRLDNLDAGARALLLAAALSDAEPDELLAAAQRFRGVDLGVRGWDPVIDAGLGSLTTDRFRFRHPLVRSAVEQSTPNDERRAMHAALAEVLADDPDRSVWHRAEATRGRSEVVANALASAAERARSRGDRDAAVAALVRSAGLTPAPETRGIRLWDAAMLCGELGRWQDARQLFGEAQRDGLPPFEDAEATMWIETLSGAMSSGPAFLDAVTRVVEALVAHGEDRKALRALERMAVRTYWQDIDQDARSRASLLAHTVGGPAHDPCRLCFLANVDPIGNGRFVLDQLSHLSPTDVEDRDLLSTAGAAATAVWADDVGIPFLRAAASFLRAVGELQPLCVTLATEAWAHVHRGAVLAGLTTAAEARRLAEETGATLYVPTAQLAEAVAVAQRGNDEAARALIADAEAVLLSLGATLLLPLVALTRGRVELAAGHYGEAYERLRRLFDRDDGAFHPYLSGHAIADLADAARNSDGDLDLVRGILQEWEGIAAATTAPYLRAQISYSTALLTEGDEAETAFRAAIASVPQGWESCAARGRLAYGVWLRRERRAADARTRLREAAEAFSALGQTTMAERAVAELRASGETARRRTPEAWSDLTPQELQIAELAARGLSNKEIGERLYISHRTAGRHLYNIFPKLGITSRTQLRDALRPATVS